MKREAAYYSKSDLNAVVCNLCPARCHLSEGQVGVCHARQNVGGELITDNYGETVSMAVDPIEKKPLYHFYPDSAILSTGPNCCNLDCRHCQNWTISQQKVRTLYLSPEDLVNAVVESKSIGAAFTYTEPTVWFEYIRDCAPLLRKKGLKVVLVSNAYINQEPLAKLLTMVDAVNFDLKGMRPDFYTHVCKGKLEPVLDAIRLTAESSVHIELTNLIIPELNDSDEDLNKLIDFVASLPRAIPLHFSAYHPSYKMKNESTPDDTMIRAYQMAVKKLPYVFLGNVRLEGYADSKCPRCHNPLIERSLFHTSVIGLDGSKCSQCGAETGIIL